MNEAVEKVIAQIVSAGDEIEECKKVLRSTKSMREEYSAASIRKASLMLKLVALSRDLKSAWEKQYE